MQENPTELKKVLLLKANITPSDEIISILGPRYKLKEKKNIEDVKAEIHTWDPDVVVIAVDDSDSQDNSALKLYNQIVNWNIAILIIIDNPLQLASIDLPEENNVEILTTPLQKEELLFRIEHVLRHNKREEKLQREKNVLNETLKQKNEQLQNLNETIVSTTEKLEFLDQAKTEFINIISHELRTPIQGILGFSELLLDELGKDVENSELYSLLIKSQHRLENLMNDATEFSKTHLNSNALVFEKIKLQGIVESSLLQTKDQIDSESFIFRKGDIEDDTILSQPQLLALSIRKALILAHKLSNKSDPIEISIKSSDNEVTLEIQTYGIVIPENIIDNFFKPLEHTDHQFPGIELGLGPSLISKVISLMSGQIDIQNRANEPQGTILQIKLPLACSVNPLDSSYRKVAMANKRKVLVVDDEEYILGILVEIMEELYDLRIAECGQDAYEIAQEWVPDLVLTDVQMSNMNGWKLCEQLKQNPLTALIPVVFMTSMTPAHALAKCYEAGGQDFVTKPVNKDEILAKVHVHMALKHANDKLLLSKKNLEDAVSERTKDISDLKNVTIRTLASLAETRDNDTGKHIIRTQRYVLELAKYLQIKSLPGYEMVPDQTILLYQCACLHDIGKIGIADNILLKPGKLTPDEFEMMKRHTEIGHSALTTAEENIGNNTFLQLAAEIASTHHEKWDGSGYPHGLRAYEIPISGRIMAIADVYDALTSKRCYKEAFSFEKAEGIIIEGKGSHFDPVLVDVFVELKDDFRNIAEEYQD